MLKNILSDQRRPPVLDWRTADDTSQPDPVTNRMKIFKRLTDFAKRMNRIPLLGFLVLLPFLLTGCDSSDALEARTAVPGEPGEFTGTTPCNDRSRAFLGGLDAKAPCHCITWNLTLLVDPKTQEPTTYALVATYGLAGKTDPNQIEEGPTVKMEGKWEKAAGHKANPKAAGYRIFSKNAEKSLSLARLSEHLIHFLDQDQSLKTGNAGWSYTLNHQGAGREN
jgi:hypothetical protein